MAMIDTDFTKRHGTLRAVFGTPAAAPQVDTDSGAQLNGASPGPEPLPERLAYSVAEAALITGLSRDLLYDQMRAGELAFLKVGRRRIITRKNLEAFLARCAS